MQLQTGLSLGRRPFAAAMAAAAILATLTPLHSFAADQTEPAVPNASSAANPTAGSSTSPTQTPASAPASPSTVDDRIAVSGNGSTLTGTGGGGGGSLGWLHNFNADTLFGVAGEYEALSISHWRFGSLSGATSFGAGDQRYTLYGDVHEGAGHDGRKAFNYNIETLGLVGTYFHRLSVTAEDKEVDVETTHGNLPKLGVSYLWNPHVQTALSYQYSINGNLGTRLASGRIDLYGSQVNLLGGFAVGQASPSVLGIQLTLPPRHLTEGYVGVSKPLPQIRSDLSLVVDYQRLSSSSPTVILGPGAAAFIEPISSRWTATLNYIVHIGH